MARIIIPFPSVAVNVRKVFRKMLIMVGFSRKWKSSSSLAKSRTG
jgi:hypothetical protein